MNINKILRELGMSIWAGSFLEMTDSQSKDHGCNMELGQEGEKSPKSLLATISTRAVFTKLGRKIKYLLEMKLSRLGYHNSCWLKSNRTKTNKNKSIDNKHK